MTDALLMTMLEDLAESKRRESELQQEIELHTEAFIGMENHFKGEMSESRQERDQLTDRVKTLEDALQDLLDETDFDYSAPVVKAAQRVLAAKEPK